MLTDDRLDTMVDAFLVVAHLLYAFVLAGLPRRGWLPAAVLGGLGLHVLAMLTPAGRTLLDLALLPAGACLAGVLLACAPVAVVAFEVDVPS